MNQTQNPPPQFTCPKCGNRMKGGGIELGERLKCPKCGARLVASRSQESAATGESSDHQGGTLVLHDESAPRPAPVSSDPDDEPVEYAVRVEPWQRPRPVIAPPAGEDHWPSGSGRAEEDEPVAPVSPEWARRSAASPKPDGRPPRKRIGKVDRSAEESPEEESPEEKGLVWEPGRGFSLRRLFFVGTFSFPFRLTVLIYLLVLAVVSMPSAISYHMAISTGFAFFFGISLLLGCLWFVLGSCYALAILRDTASGADGVELPDPLALMDSLGDVVYVLTNLFLASLPGWGLGVLGGAPANQVLLLTVLSIVLLFPITLLSALETNSAASPFSLPVWRSVSRALPAWLLFYGLALMLLGVGACLDAAAMYGGAWTSLLIGAVAYNAGWMIYFRLLGRLAWYCANKPLGESTE